MWLGPILVHQGGDVLRAKTLRPHPLFAVNGAVVATYTPRCNGARRPGGARSSTASVVSSPRPPGPPSPGEGEGDGLRCSQHIYLAIIESYSNTAPSTDFRQRARVALGSPPRRLGARLTRPPIVASLSGQSSRFLKSASRFDENMGICQRGLSVAAEQTWPNDHRDDARVECATELERE